MVLQMHQVLNRKAREYCVSQNGFQGQLQKPDHDVHLTESTKAFEEELYQMRLRGELS